MEQVIKKNLKRFSEIFMEAQEAGKNEADVVMYIVQFFEHVLGFDVFKELSKEYQIKEKYCDIAVRLEGKNIYLVEAKQAGMRLAERHIGQAESYALKSGTEWVILTNGLDWHLFHLNMTSEGGVERSLVFKTDLGKSFAENPLEVAQKFGLLHKRNYLKGELGRYWEKQTMLTPQSLIGAMFSEDVMKSMAREINRGATARIGQDDLIKGIKKLFDKEVLADLADIKIRKRKKVRRQLVKASAPEEKPAEGEKPVISGGGEPKAE